MSRPARPGPVSNTTRRSSQPLNPPSRRASDVAGVSRVDVLLPTQGGVVLAADDKTKPRTTKGKDIPESTSFDPERYNPDGSLRTIHRIPSFSEAYAQAGKARYIRHKELIDREKELTVKEIFDKKS